MLIYHHSHKPEYRRPFGAAAVSSRVMLAIDATDTESVTLRLWQDGIGETLVPMKQQGTRFTAEITMPSESGLLWYYFLIAGTDGRTYHYGNRRDGLGGEGFLYESEPPSYQITVYRPAPVPEWYKNALVYQIFPDRFRRGQDWTRRIADAAHPEGWHGPRRVVQMDWDDVPYYTRDESGAITRWAFFGGTLAGVREKLRYLRSLGVTAIYLNPIFRASSNHRYDTADYCVVDPMLGDEESFRTLCREARDVGISVILDGVFSHTGADSVYFDRFGNYGGHGAYGDENSPYRRWYRFTPDQAPGYECWWGVTDLPNVEETNPGYREFICGEHGVVRRWMADGAAGWRLDVADELPDSFIEEVRRAVKTENPEGVLIGEVWEDASNKKSYGESRRYLLGEELDATMNYPFREMMLDFILGRCHAGHLCHRMMSLMENYPPENFYGALNLIDGHDRVRALTVLGGAPEDLSDLQRERYRLPEELYRIAVRRLKLLSVLQYASPGVPCLYYGDEAGVQGFADPYNRAPYPWGREDEELLYHYRMLGLLYQEHPALKNGTYRPFASGGNVYGFWRENEEERILVLANRSLTESASYTAAVEDSVWALDLLTSQELPVQEGKLTVALEPCSAVLVLLRRTPPGGAKLTRAAGVICHLSALPAGGMLEQGKRFVDFLQKSGMKLWQILPLNPTGLGNSPYLSPAVFAGNPDFVDPETPVDPAGFDAFCAENRYWLDDYALYTALKEKFDGAPWQEWPEDARDRTDLGKYRRALARRVKAVKTQQYQFFAQWDALRAYARERGIAIVGDLPIYVAPDSADTWAHREMFLLDAHGRLRARAGVPPDYFTPDGQDWGNPLYDWAAMRRDGYRWWIERLRTCAARYDTVRLDHFRSFAAYYAIPAGVSAREGEWQPGEGLRFFDAVRRELGNIGIIAEDLGALDTAVYNLLKLTGFPGMNVWQFSAKEMQTMTPEACQNRIFYSGTHDNQTLPGWCAAQDPDADPVAASDAIIETLYESAAPWVILQLQDMLALGDEARFNVPGTPDGNWRWRVDAALLTDEVAARYRDLAEKTGR